MNKTTVTIGFTARERFHLAAKSLKSIYENTHIPFNLIVIDCNIPAKYLKEIKTVLDGKTNVKIIHTDTYIQPNRARNMVLENTKDDYVAFIENDCIVSSDWLPKLIDACEKYPAMVAIPLLLEGPTWHKHVHHDTKLAKIKSFEKDGKTFYEFEEDLSIMNRYKENTLQKVLSIEMHMMLFQRRVFDIIGPFDETVLADTAYVDVSLALFKHNIPIVFEPKAQVNFYSPPPVYKDEMPFYYYIWNLQSYIDRDGYMTKKWNIVNMHDIIEFVKDQHYRTGYVKWVLRKGPKKIKRIIGNLSKN